MSRMGVIHLLSIKQVRIHRLSIDDSSIQLTINRFRMRYNFYLDHAQYHQIRNNYIHGLSCTPTSTKLYYNGELWMLNDKKALFISINMTSYHLNKQNEFFISTGRELFEAKPEADNSGWLLRILEHPDPHIIPITDLNNQWTTIQELAAYAKMLNPRF